MAKWLIRHDPSSAVMTTLTIPFCCRSTGGDFEESEGRPWLTHRENLMLLRREGGEEGHPVECCPSRLDMIEPEGGKNQDDMYVELYKDGENRQRFYEISCQEDVFNKPCRFLEKKLSNQSRCVQKYSYTYALVRDTSVLEHEQEAGKARHHHQHERGFMSKEWKMDYIRVRSGCSCEVLPKPKKKRNSKNKKSHRSRRFLLQFDADET